MSRRTTNAPIVAKDANTCDLCWEDAKDSAAVLDGRAVFAPTSLIGSDPSPEHNSPHSNCFWRQRRLVEL